MGTTARIIYVVLALPAAAGLFAIYWRECVRGQHVSQDDSLDKGKRERVS